jgi:hypothetical protein
VIAITATIIVNGKPTIQQAMAFGRYTRLTALFRTERCSFALDPELINASVPPPWSDRFIRMPTFEVVDPSQGRSAFDLRATRSGGLIVIDDDRQETMFANAGDVCLNARLQGRSVLDGPFALRFTVDADWGVAFDLSAIAKWHAMLTSGDQLPSPSRSPSLRLHRLHQALRVADALADGASHRDIACALFGRHRVREQWDGLSDAIRSRYARLVGSRFGLAARTSMRTVGSTASAAASRPMTSILAATRARSREPT